ncbi:hypothetical protein [Streptomyces sp. NPDC001292]
MPAEELLDRTVAVAEQTPVDCMECDDRWGAGGEREVLAEIKMLAPRVRR